jgi:hypothetical protein
MEFNPNFAYMLYSATAEDNVYHKDRLTVCCDNCTWSLTRSNPDTPNLFTVPQYCCFRALNVELFT